MLALFALSSEHARAASAAHEVRTANLCPFQKKLGRKAFGRAVRQFNVADMERNRLFTSIEPDSYGRTSISADNNTRVAFTSGASFPTKDRQAKSRSGFHLYFIAIHRPELSCESQMRRGKLARWRGWHRTTQHLRCPNFTAAAVRTYKLVIYGQRVRLNHTALKPRHVDMTSEASRRCDFI